MNLYDISPAAVEFFAREGQRWGHHGFSPWFLVVRLVVAIVVIAAVVYFFRGLRGRQAETTLRDAYARGEVTDDDYRHRLSMLRETRR